MVATPELIEVVMAGQAESANQTPVSDGAGSYLWKTLPAGQGVGQVDVTQFALRGDGGSATDGAMTTGVNATTLATASAPLMSVGQKVYVKGAGAAGAMLNTTVSQLVDATHVKLAAGCSTTVAAAAVVFGTDNKAAFVALQAAAPGRTYYFPNPTASFYLFDMTGSFIAPGGYLKIKGESREKTILKLGPEGNSSQDCVFFGGSTGDTFVFQDITLEGQDFLGNGGPSADPGSPVGTTRNYGISHGGSTGEIKLINTRIRKFVFDCGVNAVSSNVSIDADFCHFEGYGSTYRSLPLGAGESTAGGSAWVAPKRIRCSQCRFSAFGDPTGGNFYHAIYVSTAWGLDLNQCYFYTASPTSTGAVVQHFDTSISVANAAPMSRLVSCDFGPDLALMSGVLPSYNTESQIIGCTFDNVEGINISMPGTGTIDDCDFIAASDFGASHIQTVPPGQGGSLTGGGVISNCRFRGSASGNGPNCIRISQTSIAYDMRVESCDFAGFANASAGMILVFGGSSVFGGHLDISDCKFDGSPGYNIQAAAMSTGMRLSVRNNRFYTANGTACIKTATTALAYLAVKGNEFSQATATDAFALGVAPTVSEVDNQGGSAGYKTVNGGISTTTPGAVTTVSIAHGLGLSTRTIAPTKFVVQAGDANARGAPAYFVTVTTANVVLNFVSALTAATPYTFNWRAEA